MEQSNPKSISDTNKICQNCLFWKQFEKNCWVYWDEKKYCTMKVSESTDFQDRKNLYKIE